MNSVFLMESENHTQALERVYCKNEDAELQQLLANNLNLLPGDQIDPERNLRWMLIKREMPVVNAGSGALALSLDFLLVDQDGVPTLVECKRQGDERAKKDVVAQVLEYAASGRHYWEKAELITHAVKSAGDESKLMEELKKLTQSDMTADAFFTLVMENLQKFRIRCILLLEDSPLQLRNLVEFVNGQMTDVELLIVEARLYQQGEEGKSRIVVPWVFGFSEKSRAAKRESKAETIREARVVGKEAFWRSAEITLAGQEQGLIDRLHNFIDALAAVPGCEIEWRASCLVKIPALVPGKFLVGIEKWGLYLYLDRWSPSPGTELTQEQSEARDVFLDGIESIFKINVKETPNKNRSISHDKWLPLSEELILLVSKIAGFSRVSY